MFPVVFNRTLTELLHYEIWRLKNDCIKRKLVLGKLRWTWTYVLLQETVCLEQTLFTKDSIINWCVHEKWRICHIRKVDEREGIYSSLNEHVV